MRSIIQCEVISDEGTRHGIAEVAEKYGILIDPHSAVGYVAAKTRLNHSLDEPGACVILCTAHPGKFLQTVQGASGTAPELPDKLGEIMKLPKKSTIIGNTFADLSHYLLDTLS